MVLPRAWVSFFPTNTNTSSIYSRNVVLKFCRILDLIGSKSK